MRESAYIRQQQYNTSTTVHRIKWTVESEAVDDALLSLRR